MTLKELIAKLQEAIDSGVPEDVEVKRIGPLLAMDVVVLPVSDTEVQIVPVRSPEMAIALNAKAAKAKEAKLKGKV